MNDFADLEHGQTEHNPRYVSGGDARGFSVTVIDGPDAGARLDIDGTQPSPY